MKARDRAERLAKTDQTAAIQLARSIKDSRERAQAFGWIARFAPPDQVVDLADEGIAAAHESTDPYHVAVGLAWPLRALVETGNECRIAAHLRTAMNGVVPAVEPIASRAEALILLLQAVLPAGLGELAPLLDALCTHCSSSANWRAMRALMSAALLCNSLDQVAAKRLANTILDKRKRRTVLRKVEDGETEPPRDFFW